MKKEFITPIESFRFIFASDAKIKATQLRKQGKKVRVIHSLGICFPIHFVHVY